MARGKVSKPMRKSQKAKPKKQDSGADDIRRAETRLAEALAEVDKAREKVRRRERDLAKLMERNGRVAADSAVPDGAVPLDAPSQPMTKNGGTQSEAQSDDVEMSEQLSEQLVENSPSTDGDEPQ